jgi:hypothetical protein
VLRVAPVVVHAHKTVASDDQEQSDPLVDSRPPVRDCGRPRPTPAAPSQVVRSSHLPPQQRHNRFARRAKGARAVGSSGVPVWRESQPSPAARVVGS